MVSGGLDDWCFEMREFRSIYYLFRKSDRSLFFFLFYFVCLLTVTLMLVITVSSTTTLRL